MKPVAHVLGWIARACFEGWGVLRRALLSVRPGKPLGRAPDPILTPVAAGVVACVRIDRRAIPSTPSVGSGSSELPGNPAERRFMEARDMEDSEREQALKAGSALPDPTLLQATGAVFQGAVTSSAEPGFLAWVGATPTAPPPHGISAARSLAVDPPLKPVQEGPGR